MKFNLITRWQARRINHAKWTKWTKWKKNIMYNRNSDSRTEHCVIFQLFFVWLRFVEPEDCPEFGCECSSVTYVKHNRITAKKKKIRYNGNCTKNIRTHWMYAHIFKLENWIYQQYSSGGDSSSSPPNVCRRITIEWNTRWSSAPNWSVRRTN